MPKCFAVGGGRGAQQKGGGNFQAEGCTYMPVMTLHWYTESWKFFFSVSSFRNVSFRHVALEIWNSDTLRCLGV